MQWFGINERKMREKFNESSVVNELRKWILNIYKCKWVFQIINALCLICI